MARADGKRCGGDHRPSSYRRRALKNWILSPEAGFKGNGTTVPCVHCKADLGYADVELDRKQAGASYVPPNLQPSCRTCNRRRSNKPCHRTCKCPEGKRKAAAFKRRKADRGALQPA